MAGSESDPDHDSRDNKELANVGHDEISVEQTPASSTAVTNLKASRMGDDLLDSHAGPWSDTAGVMQRLVATVKRSDTQFDVSSRDIDIMTSQVDALISILTDLIPKASLDLGPADDVYGYSESSRLRHRRSSPGELGTYPYMRHGNGMYDTPGKYAYGFGDTAVAPPGASKDDKPKYKTRPNLNHMDWTEWEASRWPVRRKDDYAAVDILCEEPRPWSAVSQRPEGGWLYRKGDGHFGTTTRVYSTRVESQVVVDFQRGIEAQTDWGPTRADNSLREPISGELLDGTEQMERNHLWNKRCSDDLMATERKKWARWNKGEENPDGDDLLLLPERVIAYILRSRTWACLRLGKDDRGKAYHIEIEEQQDAWTDLEIPTGHKNIVQSLIQSHFVKNKSKETHFDIVRDKGKGVILLLHGVPGVGKTATAEGVAASTGKPLLPITCGDLGLTPKEVETTLENGFQLAQAWDCDIERNALVSVFLRALEYYEGILFFTTNRVGAIDEAFKSRIHVQLYYSSLSWPVTEKIWRQHIRRAQEGLLKIECDVNELLHFAHELFDNQVGSHDKMA
ncbi:hypothetical protein B0A48_17864 [Cryoendolithus antarcticus]|uniref:ATPase AAA-type core domain-containing protein n=1 Tax=Cryoendolithus antarcticus TaxID=1507870 RepID=A0A1V8SA19_9PEZI|nr:hypothetical protein B0A48_17864 [Cryoendolithus antarcticus]